MTTQATSTQPRYEDRPVTEHGEHRQQSSRPEVIQSDLTVVGGGMAGICAAIAAARRGLTVALVHDRPVLGGNSSSEIRVWVNGATGGKYNRYSREGGIMEEILLENKARNPDGNAHIWDMILYEFVRAEPTLRTFLNTVAIRVETEGSRITAVEAHQLMSERCFRFESPLWVDASGDGILAYQAGAEYRVGREARSEYGESWAPLEADSRTLGSSIMFYSKDAGYPVAYHPPKFARDFKKETPPIVERRTDPRDRRCSYWWFEFGGELDTIRDNEAIRDELLAIVYGVWDYIKNSGRFQNVENLQLEWVGSIPGKRESRRFIGDYVLTEHDVVSQRQFPDVVAHGGWSIDLHPPKGLYDEHGEGSRHWHTPGPYGIPYRILYSKDVSNLFLAGRLVSASHVAFGTLRVQMTLATMGQAVGEAAAICREQGVEPREVYQRHIRLLQQRLLDSDQWVIGVKHDDPRNIAPQAAIEASSVHPLGLEPADVRVTLTQDAWLHLSVPEALEAVSLAVEAEQPTELVVEIYREARPENYIPAEKIAERTVELEAAFQWARIPLGFDPGQGQGLFFVVKANPLVKLAGRERVLTGVLAGTVAGSASDPTWRLAPWIPAFRVEPEITVYGAANVADGYDRPYGLPHGWISQPLQPGRPEWVRLVWEKPRRIESVRVTFNTNLTPWYNNLMPQGKPAAPECVRDYIIEGRRNGKWERLIEVQGNYQRVRRHMLASAGSACEYDALQVTVLATNGAPCAEIFEIRVYESGESGATAPA